MQSNTKNQEITLVLLLYARHDSKRSSRLTALFTGTEFVCMEPFY
jgi:hypothetical protein